MPTVIPLRSKRLERALVFQKLQHAIPATVLLPAGLGALVAGVRGFELVLAIAEVATSLWLLRLVAREFRAAMGEGVTPTSHHGPDWAHLAAASVISVEVFERWHAHHHWSRPLILTAGVTFLLGFLHGRIARWREGRMSLRIDDVGLSWKGRRFGGFAASFDDLESFEVGATRAFLRTAAGKGEIDLADLRNGDEIREALDGARENWLALIARREAAGETPATPEAANSLLS